MTDVGYKAARQKMAGLPPDGWRLMSVSRNDDADKVCIACDKEIGLYCHVICHDEIPGFIECNRWCAENLTNDFYGPELAEREARTVWRIKRSWPRRSWTPSRNENLYLNAVGFNIIIFRKGWGFAVAVVNIATKASVSGRRFYPTVGEAKMGALDALLWARKSLRQPDCQIEPPGDNHSPPTDVAMEP